MKLVLLFILTIASVSFSQEMKDTIKSTGIEKSKPLPSAVENSITARPTITLSKEDFSLPLNMKKYSAILSLDFLERNKFSKEDLNSGLTSSELESFNRNKESTQRMMTEFWGEDLVNVQKFLDSIGVTKEQIVAVLMVVKLFFGQSLLR